MQTRQISHFDSGSLGNAANVSYKFRCKNVWGVDYRNVIITSHVVRQRYSAMHTAWATAFCCCCRVILFKKWRGPKHLAPVLWPYTPPLMSKEALENYVYPGTVRSAVVGNWNALACCILTDAKRERFDRTWNWKISGLPDSSGSGCGYFYCATEFSLSRQLPAVHGTRQRKP